MKRIVIILAGGQSTRMGGADKALAMLGERRLIDCVTSRLSPQADRLLVSARSDYETGLDVLSDEEDGPKGPAAGLFAAVRWMTRHEPSASGFFTAPVDGPFVPEDLTLRLWREGGASIAADESGKHPTFGWWTRAALENAFHALKGARSVSLRALAEACDARQVFWPGDRFFFNVNAPDDLTAAGRCLKRD